MRLIVTEKIPNFFDSIFFNSIFSRMREKLTNVQKVVHKIKNFQPLTDVHEERIFIALKFICSSNMVMFHPKMRLGDVEEIKNTCVQHMTIFNSDINNSNTTDEIFIQDSMTNTEKMNEIYLNDSYFE